MADGSYPDSIGLCPGMTPSFPTLEIPYRSLVPERLDGLLAAGRNLSADTRAHAALREIPECWVMGEAAGVAAVHALADKVDVARRRHPGAPGRSSPGKERSSSVRRIAGSCPTRPGASNPSWPSRSTTASWPTTGAPSTSDRFPGRVLHAPGRPCHGVVVNVLDIVCRRSSAVRATCGEGTVGDDAIDEGDDRRRRRSGRRVDRHRVARRQRSLRRVHGHPRARPRGDRRPRLRVEPGRPEPAQPAHQRDRHPGRRHRAVQRRAAQGRRQGAPRLRLRDGRVRRRPAQQRRLGAALRVAPERHAHRRHDPGHTDGDRRRLHSAGRRRRPARRRIDAADDRLPELRGRARR